MDSERPSPVIAAAFCLVLIGAQLSKSSALVAAPDFNLSYPKAISDLKEAITKALGLQADDFKVSGFDLRDALVGRSVAYEFDVEIENKVLPLKLLEDVNRWEYVDLPIFQMEIPARPGEENVLSERQKVDDQMPVLAPFQLAGPMELWIQDAEDMRISLPQDVDAGVLKKVILADDTVVTVKGARSVSLHHPVELPLPLNVTDNGFASGLISLAERLQDVARSQDGPVLSLRIVGPTSLTSPAPSSSSSSNRLKLKRLAPGFVELSSASKKTAGGSDAISPINLQGGEATALLAPGHFSTLWPVVSINGSNPNLLGFEALLSTVLGPGGSKEGSFKVLKADVSAQTFVKIGFGVEKKLTEGDVVGMPEWRTKPSTVRMHFEVLGKVDGDRIVPERVAQVNPVIAEDSVAQSALLGNVTMSKTSAVHHPPNPFML
ncbi:Protein TUNICAMYCIN INDUCED 1 [Salvia divinorum]|uniref:Protein TUNICAMYCIN INDUCED 1 n=1 Tax=Salvia divinorum TaxID=28513 RepID=A0ABD1FU26_SALDI